MTSINLIPVELWHIIAAHIRVNDYDDNRWSSSSDLSSLSATCHFLHTVITPLLLERLRLNCRRPTSAAAIAVAQKLSVQPHLRLHVKTLVLKDWKKDFVPARSGPAQWASYTPVAELLSGLSNLKSLTVTKTDISGPIAALLASSPHLRHVRFEWCPFATSITVAPLPIESVEFQGIGSGSTAKATKNYLALLQAATDLKTLRFSFDLFLNMANADLDTMNPFPNLTTLHLRNWKPIRTDSLLLLLSKCLHIEDLAIVPDNSYRSVDLAAHLCEYILDDSALPKLKRFHGPVAFLLKFGRRKPLQTLRLEMRGEEWPVDLLKASSVALRTLILDDVEWKGNSLASLNEMCPEIIRLAIRAPKSPNLVKEWSDSLTKLPDAAFPQLSVLSFNSDPAEDHAEAFPRSHPLLTKAGELNIVLAIVRVCPQLSEVRLGDARSWLYLGPVDGWSSFVGREKAWHDV